MNPYTYVADSFFISFNMITKRGRGILFTDHLGKSLLLLELGSDFDYLVIIVIFISFTWY